MPETPASSIATTVTCGPIVAGGDALVRRAGHKVLFVDGALPGEVVEVEVTEERKDLTRAKVVTVIEPSDNRIDPPCPVFKRGCGGCQWQHMDSNAQQDAKMGIVTDALRRIAKLENPNVHFAGAVSPFDYRTTMRMPVVNGRVALHRRASKELVELDTCLIAHPLLQELIVEGHYGEASEVTLRIGAASEERVAWVRDGKDGSLRLPEDVTVTHNGRNAPVHEDVLGSRFRISARSFFQSGPAASTLLTQTVDSVVPDGIDMLMDAYSGVGV